MSNFFASNFFAMLSPSQVGRADSRSAPLWSWLPSGLTMAVLAARVLPVLAIPPPLSDADPVVESTRVGAET